MAHGQVFVDRGIGDRSGGSREAVATKAMRRLTAILAADVAGYSRLMGADEEGTLNRLKAHRRELIDPKIREHNGRIVKTTGDGMLVEFSSVVDAVRCAVEIQRAMVDRNAEEHEGKAHHLPHRRHRCCQQHPEADRRIGIATGLVVGPALAE
jgi:class 3 adenylate cyclase